MSVSMMGAGERKVREIRDEFSEASFRGDVSARKLFVSGKP